MTLLGPVTLQPSVSGQLPANRRRASAKCVGDLFLRVSGFQIALDLISFTFGQLVIAHCAISFGRENAELYQLAVLFRTLHLLSEYNEAITARDMLKTTMTRA